MERGSWSAQPGRRCASGSLLLPLLLAAAAAAVGAVRDTKYYDSLGVSPDSDEKTIQKAYRRAAMRYHPDRNPDKPDAAEKFREIAAAYEVLSDTEKRQTYDRFGEAGLNQQQQGGGGGGGHGGGFHFQHGDPFNIFENVFGGGGGGGQQRMHFQFGGGGGGGGGGGRGGGQRRESAGLYDNDAFVQDLSEDTFPEGDGDGWIWLIEFYAPWW